MELCDQYLHECIKIDPTINDYFKFKEYEHLRHIQPNHYSDEYEDKFKKLENKYLKILEKKDCKNTYDKVLERSLKYSKEYFKFKIYYYMPISSQNNFFYNICDEIKGDFYFRIDTKNDIEIYIKRLKKLDEMTNTIIDRFEQGIKKKITMYYKNIDIIIHTFQEILKNESYVFKKNIPLKNKLNDAINEYYVKNLNKLLTFLITDYYPNTSNKIGLCQYKGGKKLYCLLIKDKLMDCATPENIQEFGKIELKRLLKEKNKLVKNDEGKFKKKNYEYKSEKEILKRLEVIRGNLYKNNSKYFHENLKESENYLIKKIPEEIKSVAYYYPSDFNREKKGTFYINTNYIGYDINSLVTLSLHEGMPGHHYQLERLLKDKDIPDYIKYNGCDSYIEGWGLYSENLYDYKKDIEKYHKLRYEILRAARLIIDTGIHYFGWDYEKCKIFITKNTSNKEIHEILRYNSMPGQALTYKMGEQVILFLRDKYLEKDKNGLKDFNELILKQGPIPLDLLISEVKKNIYKL